MEKERYGIDFDTVEKLALELLLTMERFVQEKPITRLEADLAIISLLRAFTSE
jgi:hypothetical protein